MITSDSAENEESMLDDSREQVAASLSQWRRAAWGTLWVILTIALSALSFWRVAGATLAVQNTIQKALHDPTADYRDDYGPLALFALLYIVVILIPLLLLLNQFVARRAAPGRARWIAWPASLAIIALPVVMEWIVNWTQWFIWVS